MSILYSKRGKGIIKWIWAIIAILITVSMILTFSAGF